MKTSETIDLLIKGVTAFVGILLFFKGLKEFRRTNKIKRADFLDKLISEFLQSESEIARHLLDDFVYVKTQDRNKTPEEQYQLATPLRSYLRHHNEAPIKTEDEMIVRKSFDNLLDFFTKLSYYLSNNLITRKELIYFRYYILKIQEKEEVLKFIEKYFYLQDFEKLFNAVKRLD